MLALCFFPERVTRGRMALKFLSSLTATDCNRFGDNKPVTMTVVSVNTISEKNKNPDLGDGKLENRQYLL